MIRSTPLRQAFGRLSPLLLAPLLAACGGNAPDDNGNTTSYTLSVTLEGSGTATGQGISCGTDCTETYPAGTQVTLTAQAAAGSSFGGWSGACSGAEPCTVTMDADKSVTATFESAVEVGATVGTYRAGNRTEVGTLFVVTVRDDNPDGSEVSFEVTGPAGWNGGGSLTRESRLNEAGSNLVDFYGDYGPNQERLARPGSYTVTVSYRGISTSFERTLEPSDTLPSPAAPTLSDVSAQSVTISAPAVGGAALYQAGVREVVSNRPVADAYGSEPTLTVAGLELTPGERYYATLAAFSLDIAEASIATVANAQVNASINLSEFSPETEDQSHGFNGAPVLDSFGTPR